MSILLAVYGASLLAGSPVAGWYSDNSSSRRFPLIIGLLALTGATVMLCLARSIGLLVAGRILQGLSGSVVWTVGIALLVDTVGQKEIGKVLGYVSMCMSLGVLLAPLLGGVIYDRAGYYPVYYVCFGLTAIDIVLRLALVEKKMARQWTDEAWMQGQLVEEAKTGEKDTLDSGAGHRPSSSQNDDIEAVLREEKNATSSSKPTSNPNYRDGKPHSRMPPIVSLLASRRLLAALYGCVVQASAMCAFDSIIPLFVESTFNWSSIGAGLTFLALIVPSFISPFVGWISDNYGPRWLVVAGFLFVVPFWVLLRLVTENTLHQKVLFFALLVLIGVGLALVMPPIMAEITYVVEAKERKNPGVFGDKGAYAQAYALFITAFAAGTLIGPIWAGYIKAAAGWDTMTWTLALLSASGALPAVIWTGGLITKRNPKSGEERATRAPAVVGESDRDKGDVIV